MTRSGPTGTGKGFIQLNKKLMLSSLVLMLTRVFEFIKLMHNMKVQTLYLIKSGQAELKQSSIVSVEK